MQESKCVCSAPSTSHPKATGSQQQLWRRGQIDKEQRENLWNVECNHCLAIQMRCFCTKNMTVNTTGSSCDKCLRDANARPEAELLLQRPNMPLSTQGFGFHSPFTNSEAYDNNNDKFQLMFWCHSRAGCGDGKCLHYNESFRLDRKDSVTQDCKQTAFPC